MRDLSRRSVIRGVAALGGAGLLAAPRVAGAQAPWPSRPITIVANLSPGGLTDGIARVYGEHVSRRLGQPVLVENRPGVGGNFGAGLVARAAPDGYTYLHTVSGTMVQNRALYSHLGFDPDKDFTPVAATSAGELPLAVHKSLRVRNIKDFIAHARANRVVFGSWAPGSTAHIVCAKLNQLYGLRIEVAHFDGEAPMWAAMGAGALHAAMGSYQALRPSLAKGDIRLVALPARRRNIKFPDLPTMAEQGYSHPAFAQSGWLGLFAPAGTPMEIVKRMSALWVEAAGSEGGKRMYEIFGLHEKPLNHEEMAADFERLKAQTVPLVRELGVRLE